MKILISSCLLGNNSKYNGLNNLNNNLIKIKDKFEFICVCPEVAGGLSTPRDPSEIINDKVLSNKGNDNTLNYLKGASIALKLCLKHNIKYAILKEKSPSCGVNYIYDGTFTGTIIKNSGITTRLLKEHNIKVYSENEIDIFLKEINDIYH